ncbi:ArgP/LysG family DNA-binding transcriptional regulator [Acinetobacter seifertii]|uniref:ArgP/LysG family DNA-binding transcriptional regulator n=1 Tax=Acinetobacter seifertii TaxID=1530123 RepID=UPI0006658DD1|nr:ArgP/LysG family DNA-binding transcriptional regulator [Acinetobacter seifertii]
MLDKIKCDAFSAVVETGSFEKAGKKLCVSQSAISQRVRLLEERLGNVLLVRDRPCKPTPFGAELFAYLQRVSLLENVFLKSVIDNNKFKPLPIAASIGTFESLLFPILAKYCLSEAITIDVKIDTLCNTIELLKRGEVQACITSESEIIRGCTSVYLGNMVYCLVASESFINKWFKNGINRESLRLAPLVLFNENERIYFDFLESNFGLKKSMIPFHIIPSTDSYISGLACDMGYGIMPICKIKQNLSNQGIKEISKEYRIKIPLYWHQLSYLSPAVSIMNDIIIKHSTTILATVGNEDA